MRHCTLARVRRWMYLMCHYIGVSENLGVTPVRGKHYPLKDVAQVMVMNLPVSTAFTVASLFPQNVCRC